MEGRIIECALQLCNNEIVVMYGGDYITVHGHELIISHSIASLLQITPDEVSSRMHRMEDTLVRMSPDFSTLYSLVIPEDAKRRKHFFVGKRRYACRKVCIILLRIAPFQQKDLRRWWVKNMVWNTWKNKVWEPPY